MQLRHIATRTPEALVAPAQPAAPGSGESSAPSATAGPDALAVLASIGEVVYEWDIAADRLEWGANLAEALGDVAKADLSSGFAFGARIAPESKTSRFDAVFQAGRFDEGDGVPYQVVYALTPPREYGPARLVWVEDAGRWFAGPDGRPSRAHGAIRVVTERHESERKLALGSQIDPLTGVLNRAQLAEHVQRFLTQSERSRKSFAVLLVALENLFALNRTYGYDVGDEVIAGLARRLRQNLRTCDIVARHAGNKFALVLDNCDTEQTQSIARRLLDLVQATPFDTAAGSIPATIRLGGVIAPREGRAPDVLLQRAGEALDLARQRHNGRYVLYSASLAREDSRLRALQIADSIVSALNDRRVELAFQPIVHAATGETAFYEALLRVRVSDGSTVSPSSILPIAEKAGLMRLLDQRVMELAFEELSRRPDLCLSVNCSIASLLDPEWPDRLGHALTINPGSGERLTIEITETSMIEDFEMTRRLIASCKRLGVKVAMDDFGAGHTSFRNLRELEFDVVKIDGAFIQNVAMSADDRFFVRTLIDLARHLELKTVAEWVEDEETAHILREWGVDYFQGSYYGSAQARPEGLAPRPSATGAQSGKSSL